MENIYPANNSLNVDSTAASNFSPSINSSPLISQNGISSLPVGAINVSNEILDPSLFTIRSLSSQESIVYLGGLGGSLLDQQDNSDYLGFSLLTGQTDFSVGNTPLTLALAGGAANDDIYLRLDSNNQVAISTDGSNYYGATGFTLGANSRLLVDLGAGDDRLHIDSSLYTALQNFGASLQFEGGAGNNSLFGPSLDTNWRVTGANQGQVGAVQFSNVGDIKAAAQNYATFTFTADGVLTGVADGGDGNLGTLVLEGGNYLSSQYLATGPHSGSITLESASGRKLIRYDGLAPIFDNTATTNRIFTATAGNDQIVVTKAATSGQLYIYSANNTFENVTFLNPSTSLTIRGLAGDDLITVQSLDTGFAGSLIIEGNEGRDSVLFSQSLALNGGSISVSSETISVSANVVLDTTKAGGTAGAIIFNASDASSSATANSLTQITLSRATLKGGDISLSAISNVASNVNTLTTGLPASTLSLNSLARLSVIDSVIEGTGNVTLVSRSIVSGTAVSQGLSNANATDIDAALASVNITSTALTRVSGSSRITSTGVGGTLLVNADNQVTATTISDASTAQAGGGIALTTINQRTQAYIDSFAAQPISAANISVIANSSNTVNTSAKASAGGATFNDQPVSNLTNNNARTSEGTIEVAAALAMVNLTGKTEAYILPGSTKGSTINTGTLTVRSNNQNTINTSADGSTVSADAPGVGVAVALNLVDSSNRAYIGGKTAINATSILIEALNPATSQYNVSAVSGAGNSTLLNSTPLGLAGAFALNQLNTTGQAFVQSGAALTLNNTDLSLKAQNLSASTTKATAGQSGGNFGLGASVALDIEQNLAQALIQDSVFIGNAKAVTLNATSNNTSDTSVKAGSEGGIALTPAVALTIATNTTTASVGNAGTAGLLTVGSLSATATHVGKGVTSADGKSAGNNAVGAVLALNVITDNTSATTSRSLAGTGAISFSAVAYGSTSASAIAGAEGNDPNKVDNSGTPQSTAEDQVNAQLDRVDNQNANNARTSVAGKLKTGEGSLSVAAALALNIGSSTVTTALGDTLIISTPGAFSLSSANELDASAVADGSAVGSNNGVGVAVGLNLITLNNTATIGTGAQVNATGINVTASTTANNLPSTIGGDGYSTFSSQATAGAGASNVGVAGSFAANRVTNTNKATVQGQTSLNAQTGNITITAVNNSRSTTKAAAVQVAQGTPKLGVGASFALDLSQNSAEASLQNNVTTTNVNALNLVAISDNSNDTSVKAGAAGGIALSPAVAMTLGSNSTIATIGTGSTALSVGSLDASATHKGSSKVVADGTATGGKVGVGAAIALNLIDETTRATTSRSITSAGALSFSANSYATNTASATASAAGADPNATTPSGKKAATSEEQVTNQIDGVGAPNAAKYKSGVANKIRSGDGSVSIAAGLALNLVTSAVEASVADGVTITAKSLALKAANETDATATADGKAVNGSNATGIGVAVALNITDVTNIAKIGKATVTTTGGIVVEAKSSGKGDGVDSFTATATSGAGASNVGVAGSFALNYFGKHITSATIADGATINGGIGALTLTANSKTVVNTTADAAQVAQGTPKAGLGASVAIAIGQNLTEASIGNSVNLVQAGAVTLSATSDTTSKTNATAGAAGGIALGAAVALTVITNNTFATVGTATGATTVESLTATATHTGSSSTIADGKAKSLGSGQSVGLGAAIALNIVDDVTRATTLRSLTAAGDISFNAVNYARSEAIAYASAAGADPAAKNGAGTSQTTTDQQLAGQLDTASAIDSTGSTDTVGKKTSSLGKAKSGDGSVSIAAGLALNLINSTAEASVANGVTVTAKSLALKSANETDAAATADGKAVDGSNAAGIGVAVALNLVNATNTATIGKATITTNTSLVLEAKTSSGLGDGVDTFAAKATSGAGASGVGVAGSFALNYFGKHLTTATIANEAVIDAGSGALSITASNKTVVNTDASAAQVAQGATKAGLGASVAMAIGQNTTSASIGDSVNLVKAGVVTLAATSDTVSSTNAAAGAAGGVALGAAVALTIITNNTLATIGTGTGAASVGSLAVSATHTGDSSTVADGNAKSLGSGQSVGLGAAIALNLVDDVTRATTNRNITSTGDISFNATNSVKSAATAYASAAGADPTAKNGAGTSQSSADQQLGAQLDTASAIDSSGATDTAGKKTASTGKAKTGSGSVSVAAALALNLNTSVAEASIGDGVTINTTGKLSLQASNTTTANSIADGSATGGATSFGVGAAAALNIVNLDTIASIGNSATITANGISLSALNPTASQFNAQATSGASAQDVGIAGSFALNLINRNQSLATIKGGTINAGGGDVILKADNKTQSSTVAGASQSAAGDTTKFGMGLSAALDITNNSAVATLGDNLTLTNTSKLSLSATSNNSNTTTAKAGAGGGKITIGGALALNLVNNTTTATIGTGGALTAGSIDATALHTGTTTASADGRVTSAGTAGVGLAIALNIVDDTTTAGTGRSITASTGGVTFSALNTATSSATGTASAAGGRDATTSKEQSSDEQVAVQISAADSISGKPSGKQSKTSGKAKTSGGSVSVAGGIALNLASSTAEAYIGDGLTVQAAGAVSLNAKNLTMAKASADGSASSSASGTASVGVA
ncbi:MAG: beta strand repeat-containing protein, partial [Pseudanabaenaceae cyanobacterium]